MKPLTHSPPQPSSPSHPSLLVAGLSLLGVGCGDPGGGGGQPDSASQLALYEPAQRYAVRQGDGMITYTSTDITTPQRTIPLRVRVPEGATGPLPVVVVIHGGGFVDNGHTHLADWGTSLATAGYVAINFANVMDELNAHCAPLQIPSNECVGSQLGMEVAEGGTLPAYLYTRPRDASAILDRLAAIAQAAGVQIDPLRVGVLGHSGGAHATLALAGSVVDVSPSIHAMPSREPRFKAYVANSPQGIGRSGMTATSWDGITVPVLIQTGRNDATSGEDAAGRRHAFAHMPGPNKFEHYVDDPNTSHEIFSLSHDPGIEGVELTLASTAIAFLDAYVLDRPEAKEWLASDALTRATAGVSTLDRK